MSRPFRFIAPMPPLTQPVQRWRDEVRRIEDLGFSTISVSDHLTGGWVMEPLTMLTAAAEASERLRLLSLVLANDFRHPVLLHKATATLDVLSSGRVELGLGTGWLAEDFMAAGLPDDPPGVRLSRLEESVRVIKGLFGPTPFDFRGQHYRTASLDGLPKPVQRPHPPLLLGGGGRRMLSLAAREANIVGIHATLRAGRLTADAAQDLSAERIEEKVGWVRDAAHAAGRDEDDLELQFSIYLFDVTDAPQRSGIRSSFANLLQTDPALLAESPAVLRGSLDHCVETLQERRERFGISYWKLGGDVDAAARVVSRLAHT